MLYNPAVLGTTLVVTGSNFYSLLTCTLNGTALLTTFNSVNQLSCTVPGTLPPGLYQLQISGGSYTATAATSFEVVGM